MSALQRFADLTQTSRHVSAGPRAVVPPGWLNHLAVPLLAAKRSLKLLLPCDLGPDGYRLTHASPLEADGAKLMNGTTLVDQAPT
jgi:hypothetical protein